MNKRGMEQDLDVDMLVTLGIVVRIPASKITDFNKRISSELERYSGGAIIYRKLSASRLYVTDAEPDKIKEESNAGGSPG